MREIELDNGMRQVRGLTVAELDEMSVKYPISRWACDLDQLGRDELTNKMFIQILQLGTRAGDDFDFGNLTPRDERELFFGILAETYGDRDEEKNLSRSGNSTQTATE